MSISKIGRMPTQEGCPISDRNYFQRDKINVNPVCKGGEIGSTQES